MVTKKNKSGNVYIIEEKLGVLFIGQVMCDDISIRGVTVVLIRPEKVERWLQ